MEFNMNAVDKWISRMQVFVQALCIAATVFIIGYWVATP
jgi:hypothetical protein